MKIRQVRKILSAANASPLVDNNGDTASALTKLIELLSKADGEETSKFVEKVARLRKMRGY